MKKFIRLEMEIILMESDDVVRTSGPFSESLPGDKDWGDIDNL